jgi:hypothetical protein
MFLPISLLKMKELRFIINILSFFFVSETYIVERMYEMWQMKSTTQHIDAEMAKFVNKAVKYSSCQTLGLTTFILCDIPRFLYLILEVMTQIVLI